MKWLRPAILRLRALGIDFAPLLAECGITLAGLADPHGRLGNAAFMRGWQLGESLSGEPAFGVLAASGFDFRQFELINSETEFLLTQLFASSPTLGSGLSRMCHYYPLHHDTAQLRMDKKAGVVTLRHVMPSEARPARAFIEWAIAVLVKEITDIAVRPVALIQVRFAHERPLLQGPADPYRQYLGANVQFSAADNAIVLAESDLAIGLRTAKPLLMPLLERRAQALMGEQSVDVLIADRIRTYLTSMMGKGVPSMQGTARALGVSVRTLARRLSEEGTSHQELLDQVRAEQARRYLTEEGLSVAEVASRLGYADSRAFHRAFRRWFQRSPLDYRGGR